MRTAFLIGSRLACIPLSFVPRGLALAALDCLATVAFGPKGEDYESRTVAR